MVSASSQMRPARSHLTRSWPSLLPTRLESVRNQLVYLRSGRRDRTRMTSLEDCYHALADHSDLRYDQEICHLSFAMPPP
jgi:hypothetical protein